MDTGGFEFPDGGGIGDIGGGPLEPNTLGADVPIAVLDVPGRLPVLTITLESSSGSDILFFHQVFNQAPFAFFLEA